MLKSIENINSNFSEYLPFTDIYYPKIFKECTYSSKTSFILKNISNCDINEGLPNIVLYGPAGCGKYIRLMITLKKYLNNNFNNNLDNNLDGDINDKYDPYETSVKAIDVETGYFVPIPSSANKVIYSRVSKYHCEIELKQANAEKTLIPFLDYYSKSKNIYLKIQKYVILRNVEVLKKETQNALKRIVETSQSKIRFMMTINYISKLIFPLRSRFLCVTVKPPNVNEASLIIKNIAEKEKFKISPKKIEMIIEKSYYGSLDIINVRELLLTLEGSYILSENNKISKIYVSERNEASDLLVKAVKKGNVMEIRNILYKIYELMKNDFELIVTGDFYRKISKNIKDDLKTKLVFLTSKWNANISKNCIAQPIFQAEAYMYAVCDLYDQ